MFTLFSSKKAPHRPGCMALHVVLAVLMGIAAIAALVGLVLAHWSIADDAIVFGTPAASLSIIAFVFTLSAGLKQCMACMSECEVCAKPVATSKKK